jgi:hypothetical protein
MVGVAGFEPATPTSRTWCATSWPTVTDLTPGFQAERATRAYRRRRGYISPEAPTLRAKKSRTQDTPGCRVLFKARFATGRQAVKNAAIPVGADTWRCRGSPRRLTHAREPVRRRSPLVSVAHLIEHEVVTLLGQRVFGIPRAGHPPYPNHSRRKGEGETGPRVPFPVF